MTTVMASEAFNLVPYALIACASPLALTATIAVLRTGRAQALGVAAGVVAGQLLACSILVAIGAALVPPDTEKRPHVEAVLEIGLGIALLTLGLVVRRRPPRPEPQSGRSHQILERLGRVRGVTVFLAGLTLGVGGPKRLVLTSLASASITAASIGGASKGALVLWYSILATAVVWVPVLAVVLVGQPAFDGIDGALDWFSRHRRSVTFYSLLVVSTFLIVHGVLLLIQQA
jgi:hypothetical protein